MELCPVDGATFLALGCIMGMLIPPIGFIMVKIGAIALHQFINPPTQGTVDTKEL